MERVAAIDVGTNTILLLIAEVDAGGLRALFESGTVVRLGEGLHRNALLSPEAMNRGYNALEQCLQQCHKMAVQRIFAIGTSVLREAKNAREFTGNVKKRFDILIEIISGEEEAKLSYLAMAQDLQNFADTGKKMMVVDVGGGSTEFVLGQGNHMAQWVSLPLGSVRLTEQFLVSDPVSKRDWSQMQKEIDRLLEKMPDSEKPPFMVAVGGTATTLASVELGLREFRVEKIDHFLLTREALARQLSLYRSRTVEQRKKIPGLAPNRADIIVAGGAVVYSAMERADCSSVMISTHGIRYGLLYEKLGLLE